MKKLILAITLLIATHFGYSQITIVNMTPDTLAVGVQLSTSVTTCSPSSDLVSGDIFTPGFSFTYPTGPDFVFRVGCYQVTTPSYLPVPGTDSWSRSPCILCSLPSSYGTAYKFIWNGCNYVEIHPM